MFAILKLLLLSISSQLNADQGFDVRRHLCTVTRSLSFFYHFYPIFYYLGNPIDFVCGITRLMLENKQTCS